MLDKAKHNFCIECTSKKLAKFCLLKEYSGFVYNLRKWPI